MQETLQQPPRTDETVPPNPAGEPLSPLDFDTDLPRSPLYTELDEAANQAARAEQARQPSATGSRAAEGAVLAESVSVEPQQSMAEKLVPYRERVDRALKDHSPVLSVAANSLANKLSAGAEVPVPPITITAEQVKQEKPSLGVASRFIGFFSSGLKDRFDGYIARKGQEKVEQVTDDVANFVEIVGSYELPKEQFVAEIATIRSFIEHGVEGKPTGGDTPSSRMRYLLDGIADSGIKWRGGEKFAGQAWLEQSCPMIESALVVYMNPARRDLLQSYSKKAETILPEILKGLEQFMQLHDQSTVPSEPVVVSGLRRSIGERVVGAKIRSVPARVTQMLERAYDSLPENGASFRAEVASVVHQAAAADNPQGVLMFLLNQAQIQEEQRKQADEEKKAKQTN